MLQDTCAIPGASQETSPCFEVAQEIQLSICQQILTIYLNYRRIFTVASKMEGNVIDNRSDTETSPGFH